MRTRTAAPKRPPAADEQIFKAIADPTRRQILVLLSREELPLNRIESHFELSRTAIIKHMSVLKSGKLVVARRAGRHMLHRLDPAPLRRVRDWMALLDRRWDLSLQRLKSQVESRARS